MTARASKIAPAQAASARKIGIAVLAIGILASAAGCSESGIVTNEAKLQEEPRNSGRILAIIPAGSSITIGDCANGWCRASWNGRDGYVLTKLVHLSEHAFRSAPDNQPQGEDDADQIDTTVPDEGTPSTGAE
jgi:uncharacterized protein YraI